MGNRSSGQWCVPCGSVDIFNQNDRLTFEWMVRNYPDDGFPYGTGTNKFGLTEFLDYYWCSESLTEAHNTPTNVSILFTIELPQHTGYT